MGQCARLVASGLATMFGAWLAVPAFAQDPTDVVSVSDDAESEPAVSRTSETTLWYGWETLLLDGVSGVLVAGFAGQTDASDLMGFVGLGTYVLGPPIVHLARGHYWRSAGSLVMRLAVPTLGFFVGATMGEHAPGYSNDVSLPLAYGVAGAGLGMLIPVPIDAFLLGYETGPIEPNVGAPGGAAWDLLPHPMVVRDVRGSECPGLGLGASF